MHRELYRSYSGWPLFGQLVRHFTAVGSHQQPFEMHAVRSMVSLKSLAEAPGFNESQQCRSMQTNAHAHLITWKKSRRKLGLPRLAAGAIHEHPDIRLSNNILEANDWQKVKELVIRNSKLLKESSISAALYNLAVIRGTNSSRLASAPGSDPLSPSPQPHMGPEPLVKSLLYLAERDISTFQPQSLSNLLWALGVLHYSPTPAFMDKIARQAMVKLPQFRSQDISNTMWAFAKLSVSAPSPMQCFAEVLSQHSMNLQVVTNALWSLAKSRHYPGEEVMDRFTAKAQEGLTMAATPQCIANLLWSFGYLAHTPPERFLWLCVQMVQHHASMFNPQHVLLVLQGMAYLQLPASMVSPVLHALMEDSMHMASHEELSRVIGPVSELVAVFSLDPHMDDMCIPDHWEPELMAYYNQKYTDMATEMASCEIIPVVCSVLAEAGVPHRRGVVLRESDVILPVDILLPNNTAVVIHREGAVAANDSGRLLGPALLRERLLRLHGYRVVHISQAQWRQWGSFTQAAGVMDQAVLQVHHMKHLMWSWGLFAPRGWNN